MKRLMAFATVSVLVIACSPASEPEEATSGWVGTVTTEGDVTTVVNESGSVWGRPAMLVEETSIGVDAGAEPYLLGRVVGVGVEDERIFVLDAQVFRVRVYDLDGGHLMDLGREGQGPGEFERPTGLAVGHGRVYVRDPRRGRITVFSTAGELLDTWPTEAYYTSTPMVAATDGRLLVPYRGMTPWGPDGAAGEAITPPRSERPPTMQVRVEQAIEGYSPGAILARSVPFWPAPTFAMAPTGAMIHGEGSLYRFRMEHPDGGAIDVESSAPPVPVSAAEAEWRRQRVAAFLRQADPGWQWDGPEVPETKPAYTAFVPAVSGEVWVVRPGPGYETSNCPTDIPTQDPPESCWKDRRVVDVFGPEGRLLGTLDVPSELQLEPRPFIRGDMVVGVVQDEAGTIMVKRYRVVLPGEEGR